MILMRRRGIQIVVSKNTVRSSTERFYSNVRVYFCDLGARIIRAALPGQNAPLMQKFQALRSIGLRDLAEA